MGPCWKYKVMCAWLIKKLWLLNEMVMRAKTGRVASNGFRSREPEKNNLFSSVRLSTKADIAPVLFAEGRVGRCVDTLSTIKETVALN